MTDDLHLRREGTLRAHAPRLAEILHDVMASNGQDLRGWSPRRRPLRRHAHIWLVQHG